jgi:acetyl esterase/lipase
MKGLDMRFQKAALFALALGALTGAVHAQDEEAAPGRGAGQARRAPVGPVQTDKYRTTYVRLGNQVEGLLYEPTGTPKPTALIFIHPDRNTFNAPVGPQMAARGYRVLMINYRGDSDAREADQDAYLPAISTGVTYLHGLPGVQKVVLSGHSGGGHLVTLYGNVSEHGSAACKDAAKLYPCTTPGLDNLAKLDGLIILDSTLGAFHAMSSVDPAVEISNNKRDPALDMFTAANGYDDAGKKGTYSAAFAKRFYAAQAARNAKIISDAEGRLKAIQSGASDFSDDEPFVVEGMGDQASGARLYQPDTAFQSHTKAPHLLLKADGTNVTTVIQSVRPPVGQRTGGALKSLSVMTQNTTVKRFLATSAIRTSANYAITADDVVGADWHSAYNSSPGNAEGISVPTLVLTMSCHYLVVPGEIIFDHLAAKDKTYASVEGAVHGFSPCKPEYGDTVKRTFDYVDTWLSKPGRF